MEMTLARFVHALRNAEVPVSPAETLDGFEVVQHVGIRNPELLRDSLSLVLAKTREEKSRFADCFERFFHQLAFQHAPKRALLKEEAREATVAFVREQSGQRLADLVEQAYRKDRSELALDVQMAGNRMNISGMETLREKGSLVESIARALGLNALDTLIDHHTERRDDLIASLRYLRQYLKEEIKEYVDGQYEINVDPTGKRALIDRALTGNLDQVPKDYYDEIDRVVHKLADRLAQTHKRKRRRAHRGVLDIKRMIRKNIAYDGAFFEIEFRQRKVERSEVFVVCDVSGSVARVSRFLLMLLYDLQEVLPSVRSFAFSNRLGEITDLFNRQSHEAAVEDALYSWGNGNSDYGRSLVDLRQLIHQDLDHRSTLVFLGDARNNYYEARADVFRQLTGRARQTFWLNPESRESWGEGDSIISTYATHCLRIDSCGKLRDIERFADRLLTATR